MGPFSGSSGGRLTWRAAAAAATAFEEGVFPVSPMVYASGKWARKAEMRMSPWQGSSTRQWQTSLRALSSCRSLRLSPCQR